MKTLRTITFLLFTGTMAYISYAFVSILTKNEAQVLSEIMISVWIFTAIFLVICSALYGIKRTIFKIKQFWLTRIYHLFDESDYPCLLLDKKLNILYVNKLARRNFEQNYTRIKQSMPKFEFHKLLSGKYNFNQLNPSSKRTNKTNIFLNSSYTGKYTYKNIQMNFKSRVFKLFDVKLGVIIEFNFKAPQANKTAAYRSIMQDIKIKKILNKENSALKLIDEITEADQKKSNFNHAECMQHNIHLQPAESQTVSLNKKTPTQQFVEEYAAFKQENLNEKDPTTNKPIISNQSQLLEDLKLKLINLMVKNQHNNELSQSYLEIYNSLQKAMGNHPEDQTNVSYS